MLLVVDNDSLTMRPWIAMLREEGYEVELRNHVDRALNDAAEYKNLQCVIVDVMMPSPAQWSQEAQGGMATGLVLAAKFREIWPKVPIIFLTGQTNQAIVSKVKGFGQPSTYLSKLTLKDEVWIAEVRRLAGPPEKPTIDAGAQDALHTA